MEQVALNNVQLEYLARYDPALKPYFYGVVACDRLPKKPTRRTCGYIVNTDPHDTPGKHWLGIWTKGDVCEVMDSFALPLEYYQAEPLNEWIVKHWKYIVTNTRSLQAMNSESCGHYALMYLKERANGQTLQEFLNQFSKHDYVANDHKVGQVLKRLICNEIAWNKVCKSPYHQRCFY